MIAPLVVFVAAHVGIAFLVRALIRAAYKRGRLHGFGDGMSSVMEDLSRYAGVDVAHQVARQALAEMDARERKAN